MDPDVAREHVHREAMYLSQWGSFSAAAVDVALTVAQTEKVLSELGYTAREGLWVRMQ
jgi:hypothetical protein